MASTYLQPSNHNPNHSQQPIAAAETNNGPLSRSSSHGGHYFSGPSSSAQQEHPHHPQQHPQQHLGQPSNLLQQPQQISHLPSPVVDDATRINTLANANSHGDPLNSPGGQQRGPKFTEEWDASQRGSSIIEGHSNHPGGGNGSGSGPGSMQRSNSYAGSIGQSEAGGSQHQISLSRGNTLKKKPSIRRTGSLKRSSSRRSMKAGSVKSLALQSSTDPDEQRSAFFCPVPTTGNPTEVLANRFQAWRKILKDLITYFREIQSHYELRAKSMVKLSNALGSTSMPSGFLASGGLDDALQILRGHSKYAIVEATKAREIEEDVVLALTGLRSDLQQKIKEIKNLSGDFKNSVDREMEGTRKAVNSLQEVLGQTELDSALTTGKQDPYLLRLTADRQLERQIDEENYLHQAYLNLETSGRELESIVVGEIQKSYNAYAGILKREADAAYGAIEDLRTGPIAMPKDHEWIHFISKNDQFIDPELPIRSADHIHYPGRDHYACQEIRAGLLERKSKYLKSYTAGWYVLSPTHLHEFKSADKTQAPVMSLYLPEQKLGSHSTAGHSSNKFALKGRQTGGMHRGHTWVFRAESHDTMIAWYEDIKALTEKSPEERSNFVRGHQRSLSRSSQHSTRSFSSDGNVDEDEDDEVPFAATSEVHQAVQQQYPRPGDESATPRRPEPGGRFPSDLQVNAQRGLQVPNSPSSVSSASVHHDHDQDHDHLVYAQEQQQQQQDRQQQQQNEAVRQVVILPAITLPNDHSGNPPQDQAGHPDPKWYGSTEHTPMDEAPSHAAIVSAKAREDGVNPYTNEPLHAQNPTNQADNSYSYDGEHLAPGVPIVGGASQRPSNPAVQSMLMVVGPEQQQQQRGQSQSEFQGQDQGQQAQDQYYQRPASGYVEDRPPAQQQQQEAHYLTSTVVTSPDLRQAYRQQDDGGDAQVHGTTSYPARPAEAARTDSVPTISMLHVPGEYPRSTKGNV